MRKMLLAAVALVVALAASAQEPKFDFKRDTTRLPGFTLPDSVAHLSPWKPDYRTMAPIRTKPTVSMTSVVVIQRENLPSRVTVIDNNTLRWAGISPFRTDRRGTGVPSPTPTSTHVRFRSRCRGNAPRGHLD